jgi:hypothetical protein
MTTRIEDGPYIVDRHGKRRRARDGDFLRDGERMVTPMRFRDAAWDSPEVRAFLDETRWRDNGRHEIADTALQDNRFIDADTHRSMADAAKRYGLDDAFGLNKPGFRHVTDSATLDRLEQCYLDREYDDSRAWEKPPTVFGDHQQDDASYNRLQDGKTGKFGPGPSEGDSCTVNGASGTWRKLNGKLHCVPHSTDSMTLDARELAYLDKAWDDEHAWQRPEERPIR